MLRNKKIKSFTLSEMLVVMVLTTIIISIAILVLNLVQKQIGGIQQNLKNSSELRTLEQVLWNDLNKNETFVDYKNNQIICSSPIDTVIYEFNKNYILRNRDTLKIIIDEKHFYADGNKAVSTFDALELKLSKEFQNKQLFIFKTNASSYYMNE